MEKIQIVLASPSDLTEERKLIKDMAERANSMHIKDDICIDLRMWEDCAPGMNVGGPQGLIDMDLQIPDADIFICMYWKRVGTQLAGEEVAGTEHELNLALESYEEHGKPDVKAFFKEIGESEENDETKKISKISERLKYKGLFVQFKNLDELKDYIDRIIQTEITRLIRKQAQIIPEIHNYVEIPNTSEFITNFVSNNKLVLNKGYYDLLDFEPDDSKHIIKEDVFDGQQVVIKNVSNITVAGDNSTLLVNPRYANVLCFSECSNIKLIGLTLGHTPHKGSCMGSVLHFEKCSNIQLDALELFGCGTYGIELIDCTNVRVNGTKIFECSYGALSIVNSNISFSNSMIYDCNKTAGSIVEAKNSQLDFNNVSIFNNYIDKYLISLYSSSLFCSGVCVYNNSFADLCNQRIISGIYVDNNDVKNREDPNITISSLEKCTREEYSEIKKAVSKYGEIKESVFDDGRIYLNVTSKNLENISQISTIIKNYDNLMTAVG